MVNGINGIIGWGQTESGTNGGSYKEYGLMSWALEDESIAKVLIGCLGRWLSKRGACD